MGDWKESDLYNWLLENQYEDLLKARNPMSRWDCYSPSQYHRIELKCRTKHYNTLLLEKKKYDAMILACKKHMDIPVYINSTPKGIYLFNLLKIDANWEVNSRNPTTTQFNKTIRVPKEVTYLDINKAIKLL